GGSPPASQALGRDDITQLAELLRLEDRRDFDASRFQQLFRHPTPLIRNRAARAAGRIGDRRALPLLLEALADSSEEVRAEATFALGEIADTGAAVSGALAALMVTGGPEAAREAVAALGKLGTRTARAAVESVLRPDGAQRQRGGQVCPSGAGRAASGGVPLLTRREAMLGEALLAIWKFPRDPGTAELVAPFLDCQQAELRWRAAYALMRIGEPALAWRLLRALQEPDHRVREFAARGLRAALADSAGERQRALAALQRALADAHPHVVINAIRSLATYQDPTAAPPVMAQMARMDAKLAYAAATALGDIGGAAAVSALAALAVDGGAPVSLRGAALASLLRLDVSSGAALARSLARETAWLARLYAARALAAGRWATASPLITTLLRDLDARVAAAALDAGVTLAGDSLDAIQPLYIEALAHPDPGVRAAALRGVARRADPADLALVLEAYDRAQSDTGTNDAAVAALQALGRFAAGGAPVARSFYLRFPRSPDPVVRAQAVAQLGKGSWGEAFPVETGRDPWFYRQIIEELVEPEISRGARKRVRIETAGGAIILELAGADAPLTVYNFLALVRSGFFTGGRWHRVVPNFVLQDGDPRGDGTGGPGYAIRDELNRIRYLRGTVGMALSGPDTGGSQFFITHSPQPHLDGGYTVFARVVEGIEVADRVAQDDLIASIRILP
ncbi:MAG: peptidylprolyl isomerase, partial [Gemmatimonadetes bacterium]|nr:peptidylprolyl isomerase [Gemmatimonadota bacterium]